MKTTEEKNRIIAEFMGYDLPIMAHTPHLLYHLKNLEGCNVSENCKSFFNSIPDINNYSEFEGLELKYHTSWDWLMNAVEKIESDVLDGDISISIDGDNCTLLSISYTIYCHATLNSKIESTYQAVVQFIEWYNEQTK